jgi:hypothetical protein
MDARLCCATLAAQSFPLLSPTLVALLSVGMSASAARGATTERTGFAADALPARRRAVGATAARADREAKDDMVVVFFLSPAGWLCAWVVWGLRGEGGGGNTVVSGPVQVCICVT